MNHIADLSSEYMFTISRCGEEVWTWNRVLGSRHILEGVIVVDSLFQVNEPIATSPEDVVEIIETFKVQAESA